MPHANGMDYTYVACTGMYCPSISARVHNYIYYELLISVWYKKVVC